MDDEDLGFSRVEAPWVDAARAPASAAGQREHLTISEVQREFGLTQRALRFYEAKGLVSPQRAGAVRLYGRPDCARLVQILRAKRLGFTLAEIRQMLDGRGPSPGETTLNMSRRQCFEQIKHLEQRKREIETALSELRTIYSSFYARLAGAPI